MAKQKAQEIQKAYELIKEQKGFVIELPDATSALSSLR